MPQHRPDPNKTNERPKIQLKTSSNTPTILESTQIQQTPKNPLEILNNPTKKKKKQTNKPKTQEEHPKSELTEAEK